MSEQREENFFREAAFHQAYKWTAGAHGSRFFRALRDEGRILASKCPVTGRVLIPPRSFSEVAFVPITEMVEVGPQGELVTFSVSWLNPDASPRTEPWAVGQIKLDGADTNLMHVIRGVLDLTKDLYIGMRLKAVFKPQSERKGEILDISHFEPV